MTGSTFCKSSPKPVDFSKPSRACIQLMLPRSVLISPLWATRRYGCASGQDGNVLVEKRWCASASARFERSVREVGEHALDLRGRQGVPL